MWNTISEILKGDVRAGYNSCYLFFIASAPVVFIVLMLLGFPFLADILLSTRGFDLYIYYSLAGITLASLIPVLSGHLYASLFKRGITINKPPEAETKHSNPKLTLRIRLVSSFLFSLVFLLIFIFPTDPVPGEGWLRNCYIAVLFALQSPVVFLFASCNAGKRIKGFIVALLYLLFVIAVPIGLVMYHPWNYLAFFSPFYWIAWAWVIRIANESIVYGIISALSAFIYFAVLCRMIFKKPDRV